MRKLLIILFLGFSSQFLFGQNIAESHPKSLSNYKNSLLSLSSDDLSFTTPVFVHRNEEEREIQSLVVQEIPSAYKYKDLALFCKLEVQMDKFFKMPVRIRLGNLNYVNYLEGKR